MRIANKFKIFALIAISHGLIESNITENIGKPVMEITLPTEITPKRPVLPDNWGKDRPGKNNSKTFNINYIIMKFLRFQNWGRSNRKTYHQSTKDKT